MKKDWTYKKLGEICEVIMGQSPESSSYNKEGEGLPFFQGCSDFGVINPSVSTYCNAPLKKAEPLDVLMSVRAPVGTLNIANVKCCIGRGLAAFRQIKGLSDFKYIYYLLKASQPIFQQNSTGATFKAIGKDFIVNYKADIPSLEEQQQIVAGLDLLTGMIEKQKAQIEELDKLSQSIFYDMFGDPVTNEMCWEEKRLKELGELGRGVSKHRPRNAPELLGGKMPLIQTGDVANAGMYITDFSSTYSDRGVAQSKVWKSGTLCITIAANIGNCSILTFDACFPDSVVGFIATKDIVEKIYIYFIFKSLQKILDANAPAVAQKNINLKILDELRIPLPPLSLQQEFAAKIEAIEAMKAKVRQSLKESETLFNSRMDYYFN